MKLLRNPYAGMIIVILMYMVKVSAKTWVGEAIGSPMIAGDGFHNISDLFEAVMVIAVMAIASRPVSERFPFGLKMLESVGELLIGLTMFWMAIEVGRSAVSMAIAGETSLKIGREWFPLAAGVTGGSAILSWLVGKYEISVGKATGHVSMVADGEETKSDGRIELATFVGVLAEYGVGPSFAPYLESVFSAVVAVMIARTGFGIFRRGVNSVMKKSIGADEERSVRDSALTVRGIIAIAQLKTFRAGGDAVCIMKVLTRAPISAHLDLKLAMVGKMLPKLREAGFHQGHFFIRFDTPPKDRYRVAFAAWISEGSLVVAPSADEATRFIVCDIEDGEVVRRKDWPRPPDIAVFLGEKRVKKLYVFAPDYPIPVSGFSVSVENACSRRLEILGLG